jgi:glycosyltransferase involved in cell wall biosynthesis
MQPSGSQLEIVEPGGQGGVYQHVLGAVQAGQYAEFDRIIIHTARDAEFTPSFPGVTYCQCMRYQRRGRRPIRAAVSLVWVLVVLLPHLFRRTLISGGSWEIQGLFGNGIYLAMVAVPRLLGRRVVFVPHNSFSRSGKGIERATLAWSTRLASVVVVFVNSETVKYPKARNVETRRLWMYLVAVSKGRQHRWQVRLATGDTPTALFIGQLRPDKNPLLLLDAVNRLDASWNVVFAGQDKGAKTAIESFPLQDRHQRVVLGEYLSIEDFQSMISVCTVVVCPYKTASQSAVIALAVQLGKAVIASNVGGLPEQTPYIFDISSPDPAGDIAALMRQFENLHDARTIVSE